MALASLNTCLVPGLTVEDLAALDTMPIGKCRLRKNLPPRLRRAGYQTLGDVARATSGALLRVRKIGPGSVVVLQERIQSALAPSSLGPNRRTTLTTRATSSRFKPTLAMMQSRQPLLQNLLLSEQRTLDKIPFSALPLALGIRKLLAPLGCATALDLAETADGRILGLYRATTDILEPIRTVLRTRIGQPSSVPAPTVSTVPTQSTRPATPDTAWKRNGIPLAIQMQIETHAVAAIPQFSPAAIATLRANSIYTLAHAAQRRRASLTPLVGERAVALLMDAITAHYRAVVVAQPQHRLQPGLYAGFSEWVHPDDRAIPDLRPPEPVFPLTHADRTLLAGYPWSSTDLGLPSQLLNVSGSERMSLADLADRTVEDLQFLCRLDEVQVTSTVKILSDLIDRGAPYRPAPGSALPALQRRGTTPPRENILPVSDEISERITSYLAGRHVSQTGLAPDAIDALTAAGIKTLDDVAQTSRATIDSLIGPARTNLLARLITSYHDLAAGKAAIKVTGLYAAWIVGPTKPGELPHVPPLVLTDDARRLLATYPSQQTGTGVDALLRALHAEGAQTLADVASYRVRELRAMPGISYEKIRRLNAYLTDVVAQGTPYTAPTIRYPVPAHILGRLAAIPLDRLDIPEAQRHLLLTDHGCIHLGDLARATVPEMKGIENGSAWVDQARRMIAAIRGIVDAESDNKPWPIDSQKYENFLAWIDRDVPQPPARPGQGPGDTVPPEVWTYLYHRRVDDCGIGSQSVKTLTRQKITTLADVVRTHRAYLDHLVEPGDIQILAGLITAYQRWIAGRLVSGHKLPPPSGAYAAWILPQAVRLPELPPYHPVLPLTPERRAILETFPITVMSLSLVRDLEPLARYGITTLADLADLDAGDFHVLPGFGRNRVSHLIADLRKIADAGVAYRKPLPQHPVPSAMTRRLKSIALDTFAIPPTGRAWLKERGCDSLVTLTRVPVAHFLHLPEVGTWIPAIRKAVAIERWGLPEDPFAPTRVDAHLYESFAGWIDPTITKPVHVPVALLTLTDPAQRQALEGRPLTEIHGLSRPLASRIVEAGYDTILALADADVAALLRIPSLGGERIMRLHDILAVHLETVQTMLASRARAGALTASDDEWAAAAPQAKTAG